MVECVFNIDDCYAFVYREITATLSMDQTRGRFCRCCAYLVGAFWMTCCGQSDSINIGPITRRGSIVFSRDHLKDICILT